MNVTMDTATVGMAGKGSAMVGKVHSLEYKKKYIQNVNKKRQ